MTGRLATMAGRRNGQRAQRVDRGTERPSGRSALHGRFSITKRGVLLILTATLIVIFLFGLLSGL